MPPQKVVDGGTRGIIASGVSAPVAVLIYLLGGPDIINVMLTPTFVMIGFLAGGIYDEWIRK